MEAKNPNPEKPHFHVTQTALEFLICLEASVAWTREQQKKSHNTSRDNFSRCFESVITTQLRNVCLLNMGQEVSTRIGWNWREII